MIWCLRDAIFLCAKAILDFKGISCTWVLGEGQGHNIIREFLISIYVFSVSLLEIFSESKM